jgi:hypothetical protein
VLRPHDQQGIVCILDHGTRKVVDKGVQQAVATLLHGDEAGEKVGDDQVQVWRQRVPLAQPIFARNPSPGDAI